MRQMMTRRTWKVRAVRDVARLVGKIRLTVPTGEHTMTEVGITDCELTRDGGPTFTLTVIEVNTYLSDNRLKVLDGTWP